MASAANTQSSGVTRSPSGTFGGIQEKREDEGDQQEADTVYLWLDNRDDPVQGVEGEAGGEHCYHPALDACKRARRRFRFEIVSSLDWWICLQDRCLVRSSPCQSPVPRVSC